MAITKCSVWDSVGEPVHSATRCPAPEVAASTRYGHAAWMQKIMRKTNDNSNTLEHHDTLADSELDAVTGGASYPTVEVGAHGYMVHIPMGIPLPPSTKPAK
jgi:hypothetical protein